MGIGHSGLSGVRASTFELSTIGNNVANAGTVGFKKSMAEFADVMSGTVGGGVEIADLRQTFGQGSIQGTGNTWDLAISGRGFFKVSEGSDDPNVAVKDSFYTRNGAFGVDADGYVVNSNGMRLHMFEAKTSGDSVEFPISTNTTEVRIEQNDSEAKTTEQLTGIFNLDARVDSRGTAINSPVTTASDFDGNLSVGSEFILNGIVVAATGHAEIQGSSVQSVSGADLNLTINDVAILPSGEVDSLSKLRDHINSFEGETQVRAEISGLGKLKLTSSQKDIVLDGSVEDLAVLGINKIGNDLITEVPAVVPAVSISTLVNDINASGTGVTAFIDVVNVTDDQGVELDPIQTKEVIKLTGSIDITVDAGPTTDFLEFTGIGVGSYGVTYEGKVDPMDDSSYDHSVTSIIYDSLGSKQTVNTYFQKVTDGEWEVYAQRVDSLGNTYPADSASSIKVATIQFDGSGALSKITSGQSGSEVIYDTTVIPNVTTGTSITIETGSPSVGKDGYLEMDIGGTNQFAGKFRIVDLGQDGYSSGALTGVEVDEDGIIRASYTNGNTLQLGKVALFEFNNSQGLRQEGGVLWAATNDSGDPRPGEPGESIFGRIKSQSLESSSVDVTNELVNLITAQRNFQANSKMISASKEMNQVVLNI